MSCGKSVFVILLESDRSTSMGTSVHGGSLGGPQVCYMYLVETGLLNQGPNTRTKR
ncbi:hypothetical protein DPMN_095846 [Dreissena polymorpha]|uniref:Uncharacterized protein n=1 Tax=Dreissena polymorpha TaxID=45954 RepID=A0A9D4L8U1_DREPO|nr:hypothetical protein DPMN_095846 [Dreissena polymorpha]